MNGRRIRVIALRSRGDAAKMRAPHKAASADEIKEIARRIEDGLSKGAVSIGAGFPYTPAATQDELLEVFRIAGRTRAPVHVHIRRGVSGLQEALRLATQTKAPLHVVHINSAGTTATPEMLDMIAKARGQGLDVTTEAYPYTAGMTEIQSANLDSYEKGPDEGFAGLEWPKTGERLTRETFRKYRQMGGPVVLHTNTDAMVALAVNSPLTMIASDAYWENGTGHPRTTGTYSKVLGRYVREYGPRAGHLSVLVMLCVIKRTARVPSRGSRPRAHHYSRTASSSAESSRNSSRVSWAPPSLESDAATHSGSRPNSASSAAMSSW